MPSPFLAVPPSDWVASNDLAFAIFDRYPVTDGHTLVIPRREVPTWFEATPEERAALFALVDEVKRLLDATLTPPPDGYNVGFNAGEAAGQTVMHLHVHVIPRRRGDVPDPRGGIRHVIPGKGNYLARRASPLSTGGAADHFLQHLAPLFGDATDIAIIAAFVQESGLDLLEPHLLAAVRRGARVRLITGDSLEITQPEALRELLDWTQWSAALEPEPAPELGTGAAPGACAAGRFEARVVEAAALHPESRSFHPKAWRFESPAAGVAYVGSSNISRSALRAGIEWNLRADRARDPEAYARVAGAFERWWPRARPLDAAWIDAYDDRCRRAPPVPPGADDPREPVEPLPDPHGIQREALAALAAARAERRRRALVVLATGLGKTWLAAFDLVAFAAERRLPRPRVLVLAHRDELLAQAARTLRRVLRAAGPAPRLTWFSGAAGDLTGEVVLASVQKLSRPEHLARLAPRSFDYVIADEVHHAAAPGYRRILDRLDPAFLLGLTATPDRADGGDVAGLFDDFVAYRADLGVGIAEGLLAPFSYHGIRDDIDYGNIPWRNRRFDPAALAAAAETQRRMETLWRAWEEHPGARTLVFCCSIHHAHHTRDWLRARGVRVEAVHSGEGSADRTESVRALERGALDALCTVDLFNEGVDIPAIDRVVMLRPTESIVVFLQQLGRGLRTSKETGKERLTIIDFVGNHEVFLTRVRMLISLGPRPVSLREFLVEGAPPSLPEGCAVEVELEAKAILAKLLPRGASAVELAYRELRAARGERPSAGELERMGYAVGAIRRRKEHEGWFDFVAAEGDLTPAEQEALRAARAWFEELEVTPMSKSFKMVTLEALLEADALREGLPLPDLARRSRGILERSPELFRDVEGVKELPDPRSVEEGVFAVYWRKNPVQAWTGEGSGSGSARGRGDRSGKGEPAAWFRREVRGGVEWFVPRLPAPGDPDAAEAFAAMTRELVDYRLAQYRARARGGAGGEGAAGGSFEAKVLMNERDPILKLPAQKDRPDVPRGELDVRLPDGSMWIFRLAKEFCNVAFPAGLGAKRNGLPDLLRKWFGPTAGEPGTKRFVRFVRSPDGYWAEPVEAVVATAPRGMVVAFPSLRAAAGAAGAGVELPPEAEMVRLPMRAGMGGAGAGGERSGGADAGAGVFAVRASGDSMERPEGAGGPGSSIRDGDWLIMRYARGAALGALEGRVALVQVPDGAAGFGFGYQVKRIVREGGRWVLRSDNPGRPSFEATEATVPIAVLVDVVQPESLGPRPGEMIKDGEVGKAFGVSGEPRPGEAERVEGHLFLMVEGKGKFTEPDRLRWEVKDRRPGETAFILARAGEGDWRYVGVARGLEDGTWGCPELDFAAWRAFGTGRRASRRLPDEYRRKAEELVDHLLSSHEPPAVVERLGKRFRILGKAPKGGLRIDGGEGGFAERTISVTDLAWALIAQDDARSSGVMLDEPLVNRLRYLRGTPREATRWIDTGWALMFVEH